MSALLTRPPEEAARLIALTLLARAEATSQRLDDPDDAESLHDFRVALRRLRSVLRAYREPLAGSLKKRHRRLLRDLAGATGGGRDAEVAAAWVAGQLDDLPPAQRPGAERLLAALVARRGEGYERAREHLVATFAPLAGELQARLGVYTREVSLGGGGGNDSFGELVARELRRDLERLLATLAAVGSVDDSETCHRARLAAKRLRYLLEPLAADLGAAQPILRRLKRLQDLLGELNDAHVLERELELAIETAARERARTLLASALDVGALDAGAGGGEAADPGWDPVEALLTLARRNRQRRDLRFAELTVGWLGGEVAGETTAAGTGEGESAAGPPESDGAERRALAAAIRDLLHWLDAGFSPPPPESAASGRESAP